MKIHRFAYDFPHGEKIITITDAGILHQVCDVLRLHPGERVVLTDGKGNEISCEISSVQKTNVVFVVLGEETKQQSPFMEENGIFLYCAILKRENFELAAQKATEIGVSKIIPIVTNRTVKLGLNLSRIKKIVKEACEQSGRSFFPQVSDITLFTDAVSEAKQCKNIILCDSSGIVSISEVSLIPGTVAIFIGPEGGWSSEEIEIARRAGFSIVHLGALTLRAETAAIAAAYAVLLRLSHGS